MVLLVVSKTTVVAVVVLVGFEPTQTEPESGVLPLHHRTISELRCKGTAFF